MKLNIKHRFAELHAMTRKGSVESRYEMIRYLQSLIADEQVNAFEDIGFCYWNISDQYALLRDGTALHKNHQLFHQHIQSGEPCYLFWLLCDATQRLTLEKDGYGDDWWSLYRMAATVRDLDNSFMAFCVHRAALYKNPVLMPQNENVHFAQEQFEQFLTKTKSTPEFALYHAVYVSSMARYYGCNEKELIAAYESLFPGLSHKDVGREFLIGEWQSYLTPFDVGKRSELGINSIINAFLYDGHRETAAKLYYDAVAVGMPRNGYIERRL